jgi:SAM-dependent methyltransferase
MYKLRHIAREVAANLAMSIPLISDSRVKKGRTVAVSIEAKARIIVAQFAFFLDSIGPDKLQGRSVMEIGPGDSIPLGILLLGAGARSYVALDRFLGDVDGAAALQLYDAVLSLAQPSIVAGLRSKGIETSAHGLRNLVISSEHISLVRSSIEADNAALESTADYIVSFNVCEHLADLDRAVANMARLLVPTGKMIHRVDYGPHDVWQQYANPLVFLTVPAPAWTLMSSHRGCPNRVRHRQLLEMLRSRGFAVADRVGTRTAMSCVDEVRKDLSAEFRSLTDADLSVLDAEIACVFDGLPQLGRPFELADDDAVGA